MTKKPARVQARGWAITDFSDIAPEELLNIFQEKGYTGVFQREAAGTTGKNHYQIYIEYKNPIRFDSLKKLLPTAHLEPRRGSQKELWDYCSKEDTRIEGPWVIGEMDLDDHRGERTDLEMYHQHILEGGSLGELLELYPKALHYVASLQRFEEEMSIKRYKNRIIERKVTFIYGPTGTGKTRFIFDTLNPDEFYRVTNWRNPFDSYRLEKTIVLDEFMGQLPIETVLMLLDRYTSVLPARYADKPNACERVFIISNLSLPEIYARYEGQGVAQASIDALDRRIHEVFYKGNLASDFDKLR